MEVQRWQRNLTRATQESLGAINGCLFQRMGGFSDSLLEVLGIRVLIYTTMGVDIRTRSAKSLFDLRLA